MGLRSVAYSLYERRLLAGLDTDRVPRHVGVILDGNRRWATLQGTSASAGHRVGGERIAEFLRWCDDVNVEVVTLWLLSTDNLTRPAQELDQLLRDHYRHRPRPGCDPGVAHPPGGCFGPTAGGDRDRPEGKPTPPPVTDVDGMTVNVAVGYGGRRGWSTRCAPARRTCRARDDPGRSGAGPGTRAHRRAPVHPRPAGSRPGDPHVREQRLSGFLLWQSAHSGSTSARRTGRISAASTSYGPCVAYADRQRRFGN